MKVFKVKDKVSFETYKGKYLFSNKDEATGTIVHIEHGYLRIKIEDNSFRDHPYWFAPKESQTLTKIRRTK